MYNVHGWIIHYSQRWCAFPKWREIQKFVTTWSRDRLNSWWGACAVYAPLSLWHFAISQFYSGLPSHNKLLLSQSGGLVFSFILFCFCYIVILIRFQVSKRQSTAVLLITLGICCRPGPYSGTECRCCPAGYTCCGRCRPLRAEPGGGAAAAAAPPSPRTHSRSQTQSCRPCSRTYRSWGERFTLYQTSKWTENLSAKR